MVVINRRKGWVWILSPKGIRTQRVQHNEFVESDLKTKFQWIE